MPWTREGFTLSSVFPPSAAWVAAVIKNGGTVSSGRRDTVDTLISGLQTDGVWTKLDRLWILAAENTQSALTDMVGLVLATANGSPTFTTDRGYTGQDTSGAGTTTTVFINTGFNAVTAGGNYTQNSSHQSAWSVGDAANALGGNSLTGWVGVNYQTLEVWNNSDNTVYGRINQAGGGAAGVGTSHVGHWLMNRSGATATQVYKNASSLASPNDASTTLDSLSAYILCHNNSSSPGVGTWGNTQQTAMASFGGSLSSTDTTNFYNRLRTYMTAVGVP